MAFAVGLTKIGNIDIWWHLKTGEVILETLSIPKMDIFSYTAAGAPWVNHEWLFQVLAHLTYGLGGIDLLIILKFLITLGIAGLSFATIRTVTRSNNWASLGTMFILIDMCHRILIRPFIFSLLFTSLFLFVLMRFRSKENCRYIWALPLIGVIWINIHGGGILGPVIIFCFALGETLHRQLLKIRFFETQSGTPPGQAKKLWILTAFCTSACLINPYTYEVFIFPFTHADMTSILLNTNEWLPIFHDSLDGMPVHIIFRAFLFVTPIAYLLNIRRLNAVFLLLTALSTYMLKNGIRFEAYFLIINVPIVAYNLSCLGIFRRSSVRHPLPSWIIICMLTLTAAFMNFRGMPTSLKFKSMSENAKKWHVILGIHKEGMNRFNNPGFGILDFLDFDGVIDFLEKNDIHGNVLNNMGMGSQLIFRRWPKDRVFIDGRTPVYGNDYFKNYLSIFRTASNFNRLDDRYKFDYLVLRGGGKAWQEKTFHEWLNDDDRWKLVYYNYDGIVYLRNNDRNRDIISNNELTHHPIQRREDMKNIADRINKAATNRK